MAATLDLSVYRQSLVTFLSEYLTHKQNLYVDHHFWGKDVFERLLKFVPTGKLQRGMMIKLAYETFKTSTAYEKDLIKASAAIELFQAGVLIHDDIFDQDAVRRGQPSMYRQYQLLSENLNYALPLRTGESLATCVGDISLFMVSEVLATMTPSPSVAQVQAYFYDEIIKTGLAEMHDVSLAVSPQEVTEDEIRSMYVFKTGHYTFCLPLVVGALLAEADPKVVSQLVQLGEVIGLLFQIKDDELGLFGSEIETGKAAVSDVREGKKTLYYYHALKTADKTNRERLERAFGNPDLTMNELNWVRETVITSGAAALVEKELSDLQRKAQVLLSDLPIAPGYMPFWQKMLTFNITRQR